MTTPSQTPRTGDLRGQLQTALGAAYVIERELGGGGMARVFLAEETRFHRRVVIKVLSPGLAQGLSIERFERETALAAALQHAHIVPVLTAGEVDGLPWYSMPYVDGESLRARMQREPIARDEATRILADVARALAYAHSHGVVHRDIKPENILLSGDAAVVTDFGIAKAVSASRTQAPGGTLTVVGTSLGTPAYMAPEQAAGDEIDARADLYSWGVVAYELLAGRHPFAGKATAQQLVAAQIAEVPASPRTVRPDIPPRLAALVERTLAKRPEERPASALELVQALDDRRVLEHGAVEPGSTQRGPRHRVGRWSIALAAAVLVVTASAWWLARRTSSGTVAVGPTVSNISTLAVLPFVNIGGDPKDEYFSDGMTDELAHALEALPGLRLAGRTSSYAFRGKNVPAAQIGRALDVAGLVEGTVQRSGNRLRVSAQLTSVADGKVRWSDSYERPAGDVFTVQDELTSAIVAALAPALRGERAASVASEERGTTSAAAYDLYLRGHYLWARRGADNLVRAIGYFREAIAADPRFARAYAGLAMSYGVMPFYVEDPADTMLPLAITSARRALALDPTLADAHLALANALTNSGRSNDAEPEYTQALALEPQDATAHQWHGDNLLALGRLDAAVAEGRTAVALDPLLVAAQTDLAIALFSTRQFHESVADTRRAVELGGDFALPVEVVSYLFGGNADSALAVADRELRVNPPVHGVRQTVSLAYAANGRWSDVERLRAEVARDPASDATGLDAAFIALALGDHGPMLRLLQTPAGRRAWLLQGYYSLACNPLLDPMAHEPAFQALIAQQHVERCSGSTPWPIPPRPK